MHALQGAGALRYRPLRAAELDAVTTLDLEPDHIERFLGSLAGIVATVRQDPSYAAVACEALGVLVGFYVVHPSPRDRSCWWLGWFAIDRRCQGRGYGAAALLRALRHLTGIPACRRIRLLVAADNARARRIYHRAGFRRVDPADAIPACPGELVLELELPSKVTEHQLERVNVLAAAARARRVFRHRRLRLSAGPHPAWVIGVVRGPPSQPVPRSGHPPRPRPRSASAPRPATRTPSGRSRSQSCWRRSGPRHRSG